MGEVPLYVAAATAPERSSSVRESGDASESGCVSKTGGVGKSGSGRGGVARCQPLHVGIWGKGCGVSSGYGIWGRLRVSGVLDLEFGGHT